MEEEPVVTVKRKIKKTGENEEVKFELKDEYQNSCVDENSSEKKCNNFILKKELTERNELSENPNQYEELYPNLNDPNFIIKIAEKKEFNDTKYDGDIRDVKEYADILSKADFEISPHQAFVKNFMSFQTPYNSLLLYHGLGTGKTFSAIGVCEEMRMYLKQIGMSKRILIVASPNVQNNFRLQLFDERKLTLENGLWTMRDPVSVKLLREVNPMSMKGLSKEKIVSQIQTLIGHSYLFLGYIEFANYIEKVCVGHSSKRDDRSREKCEISGKDGSRRKIQNLKQEFNNRLIVIDEVHNIRISSDSENKIVAEQLFNLVKYADNLRLLLLSATPMYNSYTEIVWLLNLMNMNDRRATVDVRDIFDSNGNFIKNEKGDEIGKELLVRKATGYVSYVRGNNPYTFPYAIYPNLFSPENTFPVNPYPKFQMNGRPIEEKEKDKIKILSLFLTKIGEYQSLGYKYLINQLQRKNMDIITKKGTIRNMPSFENIESFGYAILQLPIEALNIVYPIDGLEDLIENEIDALRENSETTKLFIPSSEITGSRGLQRIMNYVDSKNPPEKGSFEYKDETKYGRIFSLDKIGKYSGKIKQICEEIIKSEGIVLIYSQYIDGGLLPMALALEELGFVRFGRNVKPLFKNQTVEPLDIKTMKPRVKNSDFQSAKYSMITGDIRLSPDNDYEVKGLTSEDNINGEKVKVVLISRAGSEGIDLKCIRQVHIMDPWYNMNRTEQTIGRAIRNFSHKELPFEKRNAEIFLHGTLLDDKEEESADLYIYRIAELKALQIGKVTRVLKETSVDCLLNHDQTNFSQAEITKVLDKTYKQVLSDGKIIENFKIGDRPYSAEIDYMKDGNYKCYPDKEITTVDLKEDSYSEAFIYNNEDKIMKKIRDLFKERFFYKKKEFIQKINVPKVYPLVQIYAALTQMIEDTNETILDKYGRTGYLVNIGEYYFFQPSELNNKQISLFERSVPIDFKHNVIQLDLTTKQKTKEEKVDGPQERDMEKEKTREIMEQLRENYDTAMKYFKEEIKVSRGDENWYKHCGVVMRRLSIEQNIPGTDLIDFLIEHLVDMLVFDEKKAILQYITLGKINEDDILEQGIKVIFDKMIIRIKNLTGIVFYDVKDEKILILNKTLGEWKSAETEDVIDINTEIEKRKTERGTIPAYNSIIGFISYEQKNKYLVFKTKNTTLKRNVGARCDESGKNKRLQILNEILGYEKYNKETSKGMVQFELCALQELLLRYYQKIQKDGKTWFLHLEETISHGV